MFARVPVLAATGKRGVGSTIARTLHLWQLYSFGCAGIGLYTIAMNSFYWYDLETTGIDAKWDRIVQFAGLRTDAELNPIGDEHCMYVQLAEDVLPNPDASLVTGLTPTLIAQEGISEWQALGQINALFAQPQTCVAGYNSLRFDDEFMRYGLYRNLYDPYAREWQNGNSRWDLIDLVRATGALRRDGIVWPTDENGLPVYKLEVLTQVNGLEHGNAHDALSDVKATVGMAQLLRRAQPKLFDYYLHHSSKKAVRKTLEPFLQNACVHVSGMYPRAQYGCAPIVALCQHPTNSNAIVVADLSCDVEPLLAMSAQELKASLFSKNSALRPGLKEIRVNRCPFVAPLSVLNEENYDRLGFSAKQINERLRRLRKPGLAEKMRQVYSGHTHPPALDVDAALYDGFLRDEDRKRCQSLQQQLAAGEWAQLDFDDQRLVALNERLKARSFAHLLSTDEAAAWHEHVASRLQASDVPWLTLDAYQTRLDELLIIYGPDEAEKHELLLQLRDYGERLSSKYSKAAAS